MIFCDPLLSSQAPWEAQHVPSPGTHPLLNPPPSLFKVIFWYCYFFLRISFQSFFPSRSRPPPKNILPAWLDQGQETTTKLALETSPLPPTTLPTLPSTTLPTLPPTTMPSLPKKTFPSQPSRTIPARTFPTFQLTTLPSMVTTTELTLTSPPTPSPLLSHAINDQDPWVGGFTKSEMTQLATIG